MYKVSRIIFVCTGNTCRSPMAEAIALREADERELDVNISSAGIDAHTGDPPAEFAVEACREIGLDISKHRARRLNDGFREPETLFAVMTRHQADLLMQFMAVSPDRIAILSGGIPDPFGMNLDVYRETCTALVAAVHELFDRIAPLTAKKYSPVITEMSAEDAEAVAAIEMSVFSDAWSKQAFIEEIDNPVSDILVVKSGDEICGYGCIFSGGGMSELPKICVSKEYRHRHTGTALLRALEERAVSRGSTQIALEVRISNEAAIGLYRKNGFVQQGIRPDFYTLPNEDALIMTKELSN